MSNTPSAAPRNRRSARHAAPDIKILSAPAPKAAKAKKRPAARPADGRFPARAAIVLALLLFAALALYFVSGARLASLREKRQSAAAEYEKEVARHTVRYRDMIERYAKENGVQPAFIAAVILRESSYDPAAVSHAGARGLMQVMPDTFEFVRGKLNESTTFEDMFDPEINIRYGCWYIGYLSAMFGGDPVKIACAYHAGPNNVKFWVMNNTSDGYTLTLDNIPMEDSRAYAGKVLSAYVIYDQRVYGVTP